MADLTDSWRPLIHRFQAVWLVFAGVLMVVFPGQWWGRAWPVIGPVPGLPGTLSAIYALVGVALWFYANGHNGSDKQRRRLGAILLAGGFLNGVLGAAFFLWAFTTPFSVMAGPFPMYVGGHMVIGAMLELTHRDDPQ